MQKGQKITEETRQKMRLSALKRIAERPHTVVAGWNKGVKMNRKPPNYKGEKASYSAHHHWVKYHKGKASQFYCVECGVQSQEWANISGKYYRQLDDWQPMCVRCHRRRDDVVNKSWVTRKAV